MYAMNRALISHFCPMQACLVMSTLQATNPISELTEYFIDSTLRVHKPNNHFYREIHRKGVGVIIVFHLSCTLVVDCDTEQLGTINSKN